MQSLTSLETASSFEVWRKRLANHFGSLVERQFNSEWEFLGAEHPLTKEFGLTQQAGFREVSAPYSLVPFSLGWVIPVFSQNQLLGLSSFRPRQPLTADQRRRLQEVHDLVWRTGLLGVERLALLEQLEGELKRLTTPSLGAADNVIPLRRAVVRRQFIHRPSHEEIRKVALELQAKTLRRHFIELTVPCSLTLQLRDLTNLEHATLFIPEVCELEPDEIAELHSWLKSTPAAEGPVLLIGSIVPPHALAFARPPLPELIELLGFED